MIYGAIVFGKFDLDMLWFLGSGIAMIVTALANLNSESILILRVQNGLMVIFLCALVSIAPQPQVWLGLILFVGLLVASFVNLRT